MNASDSLNTCQVEGRGRKLAFADGERRTCVVTRMNLAAKGDNRGTRPYTRDCHRRDTPVAKSDRGRWACGALARTGDGPPWYDALGFSERKAPHGLGTAAPTERASSEEFGQLGGSLNQPNRVRERAMGVVTSFAGGVVRDVVRAGGTRRKKIG